MNDRKRVPMKETKRAALLPAAAISVVAVTAVSLFSCLPFLDGWGAGEETGSVALSILSSLPQGAADSRAATAVPAGDLTVHHFIITGDGPGTAALDTGELAVPLTTWTSGKIKQGSWIFTINAYNAAAEVLGTSSLTIAVNANATIGTISVAPVAGNGTLAVSLSWPEASPVHPAVPVVTARIAGSGSTVFGPVILAPESFQADAATHSAELSSAMGLGSGSYLLTLNLYEAVVSDDPLWSDVGALVVFKGRTTTAVWETGILD